MGKNRGILTEEQRQARLERIRSQLVKKHGKRFLKIPQWRVAGLTHEEIGKILGMSKQGVWSIIEHHFPKIHERPANSYSTTELLKISGRRDIEKMKKLLRKKGMKPIGVGKRGELFWEENTYQFFQSLLSRCCPCGKNLSSSELRRKYCSYRCKETYKRKRRRRR